MAATTISCTFNKDVVWRKVRDRKSVVLDTNCWIDMGEDNSSVAVQVKDTLRKLVRDGLVFCPLSFGLIDELYKQAEDSRLRVGALMEELSLNISYASKEEIFTWEVEQAVRRLADAGPIDLSTYELYVPILGYLTSRYHLEFPEGFPSEHVGDDTTKFKEWADSLTFTGILMMRAPRNEDRIFDFIDQLPAPKYSEEAQRCWAMVKGDKKKLLRIETEAAFRLHIQPAISKLPPFVLQKLWAYVQAAPKDKYGGLLGELLKLCPALFNHVEVMAAVTRNPSRRDKINDFFDFEIMPVPLAYASVFVAHDRGIREMLGRQTKILERNSCRYCFELADLADWLKAEGLT